MSGYPFKQLLKNATGTAKSKTCLLVPTRISGFASSMGLTPQQALWEHTMFPYVTAFMPGDQRAELQKRLLSVGKAATVNGPLTKVLMKCIPRRRLCANCAMEDMGKYGTHYWRRVHCLPGVNFCPNHLSPLFETNLPMLTTALHEPVEFGSFNSNSSQASIDELDQAVLRESMFALQSSPLRFDEDWTAQYRKKAEERGYLLPNKDLATKHLCNDLQKWVSHGRLLQMDSEFVPNTRHAWPAILLRNSRNFSAPKHIIMKAYLFYGPEITHRKYKKSGPLPRDYKAMDMETVYALKYDVTVNKNNETGIAILRRLGKLAAFRHNRSAFPLTKAFIEQITKIRSTRQKNAL
jgi:hypothetical protein